jgi:hypothetical protein
VGEDPSVVLARDESLLIADGGSENTANRVTAAINKFEPKLVRRIARKEIKNSNTMIEIFFKMLKNNHLYHRTPKNRDDLVREIAFYVQQHNHVVPMRALGGSTPAEALNLSNVQSTPEFFSIKISERRALRILENRSGICQICV